MLTGGNAGMNLLRTKRSNHAERDEPSVPGIRSISRLGRWMMLIAAGCASVAIAQSGSAPTSATDMTESETGIPVTDALTREKCGTCHAPDAKGNLKRISWLRTTPEGWGQAIKRMVALNGLQISPAESRSIVKYLATYHGLSPEEAKPVMYLTEHRIIDEDIPNDTMRAACSACHAYGQPMSWRRSKVEWKLLRNMHVALYSQADAIYRRPAEGPEAGPPAPATANSGTAPPKITNGDYAYDYMAKNNGLQSASWSAWQPRIHAPHLEGKWVVSATLPGKGSFVGDMVVSPGASPDEFKTSVTLHSLTDGSTLTRSGTGIVYSGYSWRGRSQGAGAKSGLPDDIQSEARETLWFSPDQRVAEGRWFWGTYQEFGFNVKLTRAASGPVVAAVTPGMLKAGTRDAKVSIYGANLPTELKPTDIDLGAGVTVKKIVSASASEIVTSVDVASTALTGRRDVGVQGAVLEKALPVYDKLDYIKVTPETSLARLGSDKHPKGYQQFEAFAYANGPDGKPNTPDDVPIAPIDVTWGVEEFMSVYNDDDKDFVGTLSPTAFFTPASDGPNPARRFSRNNYGDVWVVATAKSEKDTFGKPLTGRAYLIVTVPAYKQIDQPEVFK
jgi:quinohemoprotein amine dehydrogenase